MTPERIREEMARLDGWTPEWRSLSLSKLTYPSDPPDYPQSLDAVARVAGKMDANTWRRYRMELIAMCTGDHENDPIDATAMQRCEAVLRAHNLWEEGE